MFSLSSGRGAPPLAPWVSLKNQGRAGRGSALLFLQTRANGWGIAGMWEVGTACSRLMATGLHAPAFYYLCEENYEEKKRPFLKRVFWQNQ